MKTRLNVPCCKKCFLTSLPYKKDQGTCCTIKKSKSGSSTSYGGEIRDTKTLNLSCNIVSFHVLVNVSRFSPGVINLSRNKNICCGLKKVVARSRARVYFEQQILVLLLVFHQTHNLSRNKFACALPNQPISVLVPYQISQLACRISCATDCETSTKTCNETILRDKLRVFVSRVLPPLRCSASEGLQLLELLWYFIEPFCLQLVLLGVVEGMVAS